MNIAGVLNAHLFKSTLWIRSNYPWVCFGSGWTVLRLYTDQVSGFFETNKFNQVFYKYWNKPVDNSYWRRFPCQHSDMTCADVLFSLIGSVSVGTWGPSGPQFWAACSLATDDSCGPWRAALWPQSSGPWCFLWNGHEPQPRPGVIVLSGSWTDFSATPLPPSSPTGPGHQIRLLLPPSSPLTSPTSRLLLSCAQFNFLPVSPRIQATTPGGRSYDRLCPLYLQRVPRRYGSTRWPGPGLRVRAGEFGQDPGEPAGRQPVVAPNTNRACCKLVQVAQSVQARLYIWNMGILQSNSYYSNSREAGQWSWNGCDFDLIWRPSVSEALQGIHRLCTSILVRTLIDIMQSLVTNLNHQNSSPYNVVLHSRTRLHPHLEKIHITGEDED